MGSSMHDLFCNPTTEEAKQQARKEWAQLIKLRRQQAKRKLARVVQQAKFLRDYEEDSSDLLLALDGATAEGVDE